MRRIALLSTMLAVLAVPSAAHGAAWGVTDTTDTPVGQACPGFTDCSLREAVTSTEANPGADTILISGGTYPLTNGELTVSQDLAVARVGAGGATVDGNDASRIFDVTGGDFVLRFMTLTNGMVSGTGPSRGGAIRGAAGATIEIQSSTISSSDVSADTDARGGGVYSEGNLTIGTAASSTTGSTITGNSATATSGDVQGGGVATGGTATLTVGARTSITDNDATAASVSAQVLGAGAYAANGATFTQSTVAGNDATGGTVVGGGVAAGAGIASFVRSTVSGNSVTGTEENVSGGGGGIGVPESGSADVELQFSTVADNTATTTNPNGGSTEAGGGIGNFRISGAIDAANSTIAGNGVTAVPGSAARGGGVHSAGGIITLGGTILAENTQATSTSQCSDGAVLESDGYSVLGDISDCSYTAGTGDVTGVTDAGLKALASYGGLTQTMMVELGSVALDVIPTAATLCSDSLTDQRGVSRPQSGICDSGSVEARPATLSITPDPRSFPAAVPGGPSNANVAISNAGDLDMGAAPAPAVNPPFSYSSGCTSPVAAGSSCIMTLAFSPAAGGNFSQLLTVSSGSLSDTATLTGMGWAPLHLPKIQGTPSVGVQIGVGQGKWPVKPTGYAFQWLRCDPAGDNCAPITGATRGIYRPTSADQGQTLRVEEIATSPGGLASNVVTTAASAPVRLDPPTNLQLPAVERSANPVVGTVLFAHRGQWTGAPTSFAFQWIRCDADGISNCADIPGQTRNRYRPDAADVGHRLRVRVVANNSAGSSAPALSPPTGVVGAG